MSIRISHRSITAIEFEETGKIETIPITRKFHLLFITMVAGGGKGSEAAINGGVFQSGSGGGAGGGIINYPLKLPEGATSLEVKVGGPGEDSWVKLGNTLLVTKAGSDAIGSEPGIGGEGIFKGGDGERGESGLPSQTVPAIGRGGSSILGSPTVLGAGKGGDGVSIPSVEGQFGSSGLVLIRPSI